MKVPTDRSANIKRAGITYANFKEALVTKRGLRLGSMLDTGNPRKTAIVHRQVSKDLRDHDINLVAFHATFCRVWQDQIDGRHRCELRDDNLSLVFRGRWTIAHVLLAVAVHVGSVRDQRVDVALGIKHDAPLQIRAEATAAPA